MSILHGDALELLKTLPANSVHMVVTSPPYWSLRDYGVPPTIWGGNPLCAHAWESAGAKEGYTSKRKWQHAMTNEPANNGRGDARQGEKRARAREDGGWTQVEQGEFCAGCGAWRGCLGLEPTIELYIEHLVAIFEQVRRVLRKDGTCWINLGDCYTSGDRSSRDHDRKLPARHMESRPSTPTGLKEKDLCMVPARVALALQAAGWYLRSDIVWNKTNPMPESTRDRPTKSHEFIYLLAKSPKYFYDAHAIREPHQAVSVARAKRQRTGGKYRGTVGGQPRGNPHSLTTNLSNALSHGGRNRRSVWTLPTAPFKGAHFATFPPRLVEPCILAGSSEHGCCGTCGTPWKRVTKLGDELTVQKRIGGANKDGQYHGRDKKNYAAAKAQSPASVKASILKGMRERLTIGWVPTCKHEMPFLEPCVVLDPFAGAGTVGLVCERLGREFLGIELGSHNVAMAEERIAAARPKVEVPA